MNLRSRSKVLPILCLIVGACVATVGGVPGGVRQPVTPPGTQRTGSAGQAFVERAAAAVCAERELDPRGSAPIDEMQARPSLHVLHSDVLAGASRAEGLLPLAKELAAESLERLMAEGRINTPARRAALARIGEVRRVKPDVSLRDNASIVYADPHVIRFGTLFLAGLRSDEGMVSVMAHELTHAADGASGSLAPLFRRVARRAETRSGLRRMSPRRAEELTSDLVGVMAARLFIARNAGDETTARRVARAAEHNCVEHDETDAAHLSPRTTLRALLSLEPAFASDVTGETQSDDAVTLNHTAPGGVRRDAPGRNRARSPRQPPPPPRLR